MEKAAEVGRAEDIDRSTAARALRLLEELETFSGGIVLRPNHLANLERVLQRVHHYILTVEHHVLRVRAQLLLLREEGVVAEYCHRATLRTILADHAGRVHRVN